MLLAWAMDAGWHGVMEPGWCAQLLQLWVRRTIRKESISQTAETGNHLDLSKKCGSQNILVSMVSRKVDFNFDFN